MRPASISDRNLLAALGGVVSRFGIEGASLSRLSEASGLKRASLYHRFPGGKDEIVSAVVESTVADFDKALAPAFTDADPAERAANVAEAIDAYYQHGKRSCLIIALSVAEDGARAGAGSCIDSWSGAFEKIARDAGMTKADAAASALDAVAAIEGALIIAATTDDAGPFERALASLPQRLATT